MRKRRHGEHTVGRVGATLLCLVLVVGACSKTSTHVSNSSVQEIDYSDEQLLAALRSVSLRTRLKLPDESDREAIISASTPEASYSAYDDAVDRYVNSAEFEGAMKIFFRQLFGMGAEGGGIENDPANLAAFVVTRDKPYSELLTANYRVVDGIPIVGQDSSTPLEALGGFATLKSWLIKWYGNGFGFNYVREIAMSVKCYRYPDPDTVGAWSEDDVHPKYHNKEDQDEGINCFKCHTTMNARRPPFFAYGADGLYDKNRDQGDAEPVNFDGSPVREPRTALVKPRFSRDFEEDVNNLPMVGDYMNQLIETDQFKTCTARRFLAFALGYQAAGAPGQDPIDPFDFAASSKTGDAQLLEDWTDSLVNTHQLLIRPFLVDFMTHRDFIERVTGVIL